MGWAVFADADRVVGENVNVGQPRQCGQANRRPRVIGKNKEGRARSPENSVIGDAIQNRAHSMLANAKTDIAAPRIIASEIAAFVDVVHRRTVKIRASANQIGHRFSDGLKHFATSLACRQFCVRWKWRNFAE